jgi:hypothetical protein
MSGGQRNEWLHPARAHWVASRESNSSPSPHGAAAPSPFFTLRYTTRCFVVRTMKKAHGGPWAKPLKVEGRNESTISWHFDNDAIPYICLPLHDALGDHGFDLGEKSLAYGSSAVLVISLLD